MNIHRIQTGYVKLHKEHVENQGNYLYWMFFTKNWTEPVPINAYLVEHPKGLVLFDTGESPEVNNPDYYPQWSPSFRKVSQMTVNEEDSILHGLKKLGFKANDIKFVVLSHLHTDHIGGMSHFPNATFVISEQEWKDGHKFGAQFFAGYQKSRFDLPGWTYQIIQFRPLEQAKRFKVGYDLFEDGSLILVPTPGHTRGHQSMLVYGENPVCLAGDAIFSQRHLRETIPFGITRVKAKSLRTIPLLREWALAHHEAPILSGHDLEAGDLLSKWKTNHNPEETYDESIKS